MFWPVRTLANFGQNCPRFSREEKSQARFLLCGTVVRGERIADICSVFARLRNLQKPSLLRHFVATDDRRRKRQVQSNLLSITNGPLCR